jgi:hypothetical protein
MACSQQLRFGSGKSYDDREYEQHHERPLTQNTQNNPLQVHPSPLHFRLAFTLRFRRKQIAMIRTPPDSNTRSPTLNSPSHAWSARNGNRVFDVAACHTGLAG